MNRYIRPVFAGIIFILGSAVLWSAPDSYTRGEQLFRENKPAEALPYLEQAVSDPASSSAVFNYLGLSYQQLGRYQEALDTFQRGLNVPGSNKKQLYYNSGNAAFFLGNYPQAEEFYTLALSADPSYAGALLNRANVRVRMDKLEQASADYASYLTVDPSSPQRDRIVMMRNAIQDELRARETEKVRIAQEEQRIAAEQERIAAEKAAERERLAEQERVAAEERAAKAKADAERRQKLLEEIASSLQTSEESTSLSAGNEGIMEYDYESELE